jgi:cytochrome c oxidase assembly factor 4
MKCCWLLAIFKRESQMGQTSTKPTQVVAEIPLDDDDEEDPWITRIKKSGCYDQHVALQDCYYDTKDWRACREEMNLFRVCFAAQQKKKESGSS